MSRYNKLPNERSFSHIASFILWCACVDKELLKNCSNSIVMKYKALGLLIIVPALFALPSATFFIKTAFFPTNDAGIYPAIVFGLLWSWVILSFDRFLIITYNDGGIVKAIGRLLIGALISFILSEPLVLQMFYNRLLQSINIHAQADKDQIIKNYEDKIAIAESKITEISHKSIKRDSSKIALSQSPAVNDVQVKIASKQAEISRALSEYSDEVAGASTSRTAKKGPGPVSMTIKNKIDQLKTELAQLGEDLQQAKAEAQEMAGLKKQQAVNDENNLNAVREIDLRLINEQSATIGELKQAQLKAVADYDKYVVADFLALSEELDMLAATHSNVKLQKWLFTALLFVIDLFALALKSCVGKDDELCQLQATQSLERNLIQEVKQQALLDTLGERMEFQHKLTINRLEQDELSRVTNDKQAKMALFSQFILGHSAELNNFQTEFLNNPHYKDSLLKEYNVIADQAFDDVLAKTKDKT